MLREIISDIHQQLIDEGLHRAERNFTLQQVPATATHGAFTLGDLLVTPQYHPGQRVHYNRLECTLLVLCHVYGQHNPRALAEDGYLAALDIYRIIEDLIVLRQQSMSGEETHIASATLQPLDSAGSDEYLVWTFRLRIDANRTMTLEETVQ